jgi:radical SAM superfamily enzyme YgiQ (UPF0313 family)
MLFNSSTVEPKKDVLEAGNLYPRIGIASIASYLLDNGMSVSIMDPDAYKLDVEQIRDRVKQEKPDVVGLPAFTEEVCDANEIAKAVKEVNPDILTVVGGPHPSAIPMQTLEEFPHFDVAVFGEGEIAMQEIVHGKPLEEIQGIAFRKNRGIRLNSQRSLIKDINSVPFPAWQLYDLDKYKSGGLYSGFKKKGQLELPVEGARGCPYSCIFCFRVAGKTIRFRSPSRVVDDVERDLNEFHAGKIHFVEGTFGVNKKIANEMCNELIERGLHEKMEWSTGGRVDAVDRELLEKMWKAGCGYIGFGVESGDPRLLKIIGKNTSLNQARKAFEICNELGIKTEANFILGHPFETEETILKTIKFAKELKADHATFAILVPFPGTEVSKMASEGIGGLQIRKGDWSVYGKQLGDALELAQLSRERLVKLQMRAYREFYFRPKKIRALMGRMSMKRAVYSLRRFFSYSSN